MTFKSIDDDKSDNTLIVTFVQNFYRRWAYFIDRHAIKIIILCIAVSLLCTAKILFTPIENDITGYTPYGVRARDELAIQQEFFNEEGGYTYLTVLIKPKNGANMMKDEYLKEVLMVDDLITHNFTIFNHYTNISESYSMYCRSFCHINEPLRQFYHGYKHQLSRLEKGEPLNGRLLLNYPIIDLYGRKLNIQQNFFGLKVNDSDPITNVEAAELVGLFYKAERVGGWTDQEVKTYEMSINNYFKNIYKSKNLEIMTVSRIYIEVEVMRAGMTMVPILGVGFVIMSICSSITVLCSALYMRQASFGKVILAISACICPFMASGTALGILFLMGVRFSSVLLFCPFLVLVIGVDDAYLMIHSWQRISKKYSNLKIQTKFLVAERLSEVLTETGPAILISVLTNIFADLVGSFTGSPEITLLCIGNMAAIFIDLFFQVTLFCSVMVIVGKIEVEDQLSSSGKSCDERCLSNVFFEKFKNSVSRFIKSYVAFITNSLTSTIICILWLALLGFSISKLFTLEVNLTTQKLLSYDSPLLEVDHYREHVVVPTYSISYFFVNNPGNLSNPRRLHKLNHMVHRLENLPESWGQVSTYYFMRDYRSYQIFNNDYEEVEEMEEVDSYENGSFENHEDENSTAIALKSDHNELRFNANELNDFLHWPEYEHWKGFLKMGINGNETELKSFFFTTAYHGESLHEWRARAELLSKLREIIDEYRDFNVSVFHDQGIFLDLVHNMPTDMWQSALGTAVCMGVICYVFMYDKMTVLATTSVITSIMTCALGLLSWEGVTMDPIMMAAMIISIGFSVDIPAHVAYHFHTAGKDESHAKKLSHKEKLLESLSSVGFPAVQASLSTTLCVLSLVFVPIYMSHVFVKTMILCIILCILHSLIILPAILNLTSRIIETIQDLRIKILPV